MNLWKQELKAGLKPFFFWTLGLFFLVFAGMTKYTGIAVEGASVGEMIAQFPRVVQAVLGIVGLNIETLGGYYAILAYFAMLCTAMYAVALGTSAVNREAIDKTYEFVFTKPRTRSYILFMKLISGFFYLLCYCALNYLFAVGATALLSLKESIYPAMLLFSVSNFLVGFLFFSIAALFAAAAQRAEKGMFYSNLFFLFAFVCGIVFDMLEDGGILRIFTPIRYFLPIELLAGELNIAYALLSLALAGVALAFAFQQFNAKDLKADT